MSRGPGNIETRIANLFAATRDRALTVDDITCHAFACQKPTRAQRLSATRAAHRLLRRVRDAHAQSRKVRKPAWDKHPRDYAKASKEPEWLEADKLYEAANRIGLWMRHLRGDKPGTLKGETDFWCVTHLDGRLLFHPPDVPVQVWAVLIEPHGITWFDAEIIRVTERNVVVRYAGETARLNRESLWYWWAFWRGVMFVSSRTGRIAVHLDRLWWKRYGTAGAVPPSMQMPLAEAMALLRVPADYTKDDVLAAFRREAKKAHPGVGGTAEMFRHLVEARDRLLAALGTSAPAPEPPTYAPKGTAIVYRTVRSSARSIGSSTRLLR